MREIKIWNPVSLCFALLVLFIPIECNGQWTKLDSAYQILSNPKNDTSLAKALCTLASSNDTIPTETKLKYLNRSLDISFNLLDSGLIAQNYFEIGRTYQSSNEPQKAFIFYAKATGFIIQVHDYILLSKLLNNVGIIYKNWGNYEKALTYYHAALKYSQLTSDVSVTSLLFNNIGHIYYHINQYDKALEYFNQALEKNIFLNDTPNIAAAYNNIGSIHIETKNFEEAITYLLKSENIYQELGNDICLSIIYSNIGSVYEELLNYRKALLYYEKALDINLMNDNKQNLAHNYNNLGLLYIKMKYYDEAEEFLFLSLKVAHEINEKEIIIKNYYNLSQLYENKNNLNKALTAYKTYASLKDSVINENTRFQIVELETRYETDKNEHQIELQQAQLAEKDAKMKQQLLQKTILIFLSVLLLMLAVIAYRSYYNKKRANIELAAQKEEIETQRDEIEAQRNFAQEQKEQIEWHQKEIKDSIRYAQRIQAAVMPPDDYLHKILPDHFIINIPRNIVSGDFYWVCTKGHKLYFALSDCTGHGVPGGFMSMMGISFLNEIMNETRHLYSNNILELLRKYVIESLHQTSETGGMKDGMDISLCIFDPKEKTLEFSGAFSPLYIYQNDLFREIKGDKMPIGFYRSRMDGPFTRHLIEVTKNCMLYLFTDGYIDQFGGTDGDKFKTENFKSLLQVIHNKPLDEQKEILVENHLLWKGKHDQVDDILLMGIRLNNY